MAPWRKHAAAAEERFAINSRQPKPDERCDSSREPALAACQQVDLTPTRLGDTGRRPIVEPDDFPLRLHNLQSCLADGRLLAQFILAEKSG